MFNSVVPAFAIGWLLVVLHPDSVVADDGTTNNVMLVTIDGLRWQDLFAGADERLINRESGGVRNVDAIRQRFWTESPQERRTRLMPFFWNVVAKNGQVFGDMAADSVARVTNGRNFSYPGYNEILCGFGDEAIDSNAKRPNRNVTILEWLNLKPNYQGRVAAFGSWVVFPYILNQERSGIYVNAGWEDLEIFANEREKEQWNLLANSLPRYWNEVRYDAFTFRGALEYLQVMRPHVLYVASARRTTGHTTVDMTSIWMLPIAPIKPSKGFGKPASGSMNIATRRR